MVQMKTQWVPNHLAFEVIKGTGNQKEYITVHQTGNTAVGADAQMHANLQSNGNPRLASWHYQVDDDEAIQSFQHTSKCYHAGDGYNGTGNNHSIGVEICINADGNYNKAVQNGAELVKQIMEQENIPLSNVHQHNYWDGKNCPAQIRANKNGINWNDFLSMVQGQKVQPNVPNTKNGAELVKNENGSFTTKQEIDVYKAPSTKSTQTGTLPKGYTLDYDKVYKGNGHRWLSYIANSGNRLYMAYRAENEPNEARGTFGSATENTNPDPVKTENKGDTLHLPASADRWKVYNAEGPYTLGNQIHELTPSAYGGLEYEIKGNPAPHVYLIDTGVKGRVAIYAHPDTGAEVSGSVDNSNDPEEPTFIKHENATFVPNTTVNVRNAPSTNGKVVATYKSGDQINYDSVYENDGHRWISYVSYSGARRYMAYRKLDGNAWGTFK